MFNLSPELNLSLSNLGQMCEIRNRARDFVHLTGDLLQQPHQSEPRATADVDGDEDDDDRRIGLARFLLRLVNDTFLALPLDQCRAISSHSRTEPIDLGDQTARYDACLVDWARARLVNFAGAQNDANGSSSSSSSSSLIQLDFNNQDSPIGFTLTSPPSPPSSHLSPLANHPQSNHSTQHQLDYNLIKTTYLSISSLLSFCGILINLFIILIIIFNTKQKHRSVIRSNNTNQNNLLLLQLTLTGILLSSYVLLENLSIKNQQLARPDLLPGANSELPFLTSSACAPVRDYSPLFNFLPPTIFHLESASAPAPCWPSINSNSQQRHHHHCAAADCTCDEETLDGSSSALNISGSHHLSLESSPNFALILEFASSEKTTTTTTTHSPLSSSIPKDANSERPPEPWYLEYHVLEERERNDYEESGGANQRRAQRLMGLSGSLASISVGEPNCRAVWETKEEEPRVRARSDSIEYEKQQQQQQQESRTREYSSSSVLETSRTDKASEGGILLPLLTRLMPLFVNVLASVHIWTVAALAYDRYCAIAHPLQYLRSIHTSRVRTFFIVSWAISILLNLLWPLTLNQIISHEQRWPQSARRSDSTERQRDGPWTLLVDDDLELEPPNAGAHGQVAANVSALHLINGFRVMRECQFTTATGPVTNCPPIWSSTTADFPPSHPANSIDIYLSMRASLIQAANELNLRNETEKSSTRNKFDDLSEEATELMGRMKNGLTVELTSLLLERWSLWLSRLKGGCVANDDNNNNNTPDAVSSQPAASGPMAEEGEIANNLYVVLLLTYSLLGFLVIILIPLLIITICSIMIYRIVKVHERRLSFNSGSNINTSASNLNYTNYQIHNHPNHISQQQQTKSRNNNKRDNASDDNKSDTSSITSLLVGKLLRVGLLRGGSAAASRQDEEAHQVYCYGGERQSCPAATTNSCAINKLYDCDTRNAKLDVSQIKDKSEQQQQFDGNCQSTNGTNIVNRSKRTIVRQDSYQPLARLNGDPAADGGSQQLNNEHLMSHSGSLGSSAAGNGGKLSSGHHYAPSMFGSPHHHQHQRVRVKRKASDHTIREFNLRKDSCTSQASDFDLPDNCSFNDSPVTNLDLTGDRLMHHESSSGGIMNQLKLAGLSFAGIAIQESSSTAIGSSASGRLTFNQRSSLLKSSSCSLTSLNTAAQNQVHSAASFVRSGNNHVTSVSRCSMETSSTMSHRKSYLSLHNSFKQHQDSGGNCKCLSKLLDDDSDSVQPSQSATQSVQYVQNGPRLPFTLGTKSPAFNVVIWLILSLLIFTLPLYILDTVNQMRGVNIEMRRPATEVDRTSVSYDKSLVNMVGGILDGGALADIEKQLSPPSQVVVGRETFGRAFWDMISVWLSCICRVLFLAMVPLNGWLYGIRSRSLRATLRMVLKRYISRRQASIEINQRQRSITSVRSRDSSFMNLPPLYYNHNSSVCASCNYRMSTEGPEKIFRRCSSFSGGFKRDSQSKAPVSNENCIASDHQSEDGKANDELLEQTQALLDNRAKTSNGNTIRFLIGESSSDRESDNQTPANQHLSDSVFPYYSQSTSPVLSLAGSNRSLVSASIQSVHSILFDDIKRSSQDHTSPEIFSGNKRNFTNQNSGGSFSPTKGAKEALVREVSNKQPDCHNLKSNSCLNCSSGLSRTSNAVEYKPPPQNPSTACTEFPNARTHNSPLRSMKNETKIREVQRRSSTEPVKPNDPMNVGPNENNLNLRKSSSEFRFVITSADQEQHALDFDYDGDGSKAPGRRDVTIDLESNGAYQTRLTDIKERALPGDWWNELKINLTKIVLNASAKLLPSNQQAAEVDRQDHSLRGCTTTQTSDQRTDVEVQKGRRVLVRKNGFDCGSLEWMHQNLLINNLKTNSDPASFSDCKRRRKKKRLRNSLTLNNIDMMKTERFSSRHSNRPDSLEGTDQSSCNSSSKTLDHQSPTYLKPPNFLKLIFVPNSHTSTYSGPSALSPIKECSSNHSYASSQSSLNNNINQSVVGSLRRLSTGDPNNMLEASERN